MATPEPSQPQSESNGMPVMDFVCLGPTQDAHFMFSVASSPGNYSNFPQMKYARNRARELRIGHANVQSARRWLAELKEFEEAGIRAHINRGLSQNNAKIQARTDIVTRQRSFRRHIEGLQGHYGQAVNSKYRPEPCCYKCQAMFGFTALIPDAPGSIDFKNTMRKFNWKGANAIACAEFMVAMICDRWP